MPQPLTDFTQQLTASGLMSADELQAIVEGLPADARPTDGETLAKSLVKAKKLTKFQAEQLYAGKGKSLTLGNYVILDKLGEGGMGMVLKAWHRRMERTVALKVIAPKVVKEPSALKRFQREVIAAAKLTHPNIVAAYDADEAKGTHFLVMEYVEGSDLSSWVKEHGPLPVEQAVSCIMQAARGLAFAHDKGVVHRDIKPHNLLMERPRGEPEGVSPRTGSHVRGLTPSGSPMEFPTVKILDMGLARIEGGFGGSAEQADLTRSGAMMGTVDYMSPEQAMDSKHADARSDIYSLGCTLFYLVTGHVAFEADTVMKRLTAHQSAPPPSLVDQLRAENREPKASQSAAPLDSGLASLDAVFRRMVAKKPEDRPQSMLQVIAELERCLASSSGTISSGSVPGGHDAQRLQHEMSGASRTSRSGSVGTAVAQSVRDAETIVDAPSTSKTSAASDETMILDSSVATSPTITTNARPKLSRKAILIFVATVVVLLLVVLFATRGKSGKPTGEKEVAKVGDTDGGKRPTTGVVDPSSLSTTSSVADPTGGTAPPPAVFPFDAATAVQHQEAWARYLGVPVEFTNSLNVKGNRAAARNLGIWKTRQPPLRLTALFGFHFSSSKSNKSRSLFGILDNVA